MFLFRIIFQRVRSFKTGCVQIFDNTMERAFKGGMLSMIMLTLIWIAIFLYVLFYYTYVPAPSYVRPVNLQIECFRPGKAGRKYCPYPTAHVRLTKKNHLLKMGQPYKFKILLEMPESPVNKNLGMFMVCIHLQDKNGYLTSQSCRSGMLHYRSDLLHQVKVLLLVPLFIFGSREEKQILTFELYSDFEEDQDHPVTDVYVEVQSHDIEIYSTTLHINANLVGLSYFMYYWPITSSIIGIALNLFLVFFTASLSFYHNFFIESAPMLLIKSHLKKSEITDSDILQPKNIIRRIMDVCSNVKLKSLMSSEDNSESRIEQEGETAVEE